MELKERIEKLEVYTPTNMADQIMCMRHYTDSEIELSKEATDEDEQKRLRFSLMANRLATTVFKNDNGLQEDANLAITRRLFLPSSPYLANCGIGNTNMSCFVIPVKDSIDGIFDSVKNCAKIQAAYGGVGMDLSVLRPKGWYVKSMLRGGASGPVAFMNVFDSSAKSVFQGGARSGAMMCVLRVDHPDIKEYIHCKDVDGVLSSFNISVGITNKFIEAVVENKKFQLEFDGRKGELVEAKELWEEICEHAWSKAEPGLLFLDTINDDNLNLKKCGPITASNPCQPEFATLLTPDGIRQFKDIEVGSVIWTGLNWTKVIRKEMTGLKDVYRYRTSTGYFIGTENHNVFSNNKKTKVDIAQSIDRCLGFGIFPGESFEDIPEAIIAGLIINDDIIWKTDNKNINIIKSLIGLDPDVNFRVKTTRSILEKYKSIPEKYRFGNTNERLNFLKGLYSVNANVVKKDNKTVISLKHSSIDFILQVQEMLSSLNIESYYTTGKNDSQEIYDLLIITDIDLFYYFIGFIQNYKMEKLKEGLNHICYDKKYTSNKIEKKTKIATKIPVYSITVEDEQHRYWTGGVFAANCGEACLLPNEACNLGSINLSMMVKDGKIDWELLQWSVKIGVKFLNSAYDVNEYPLEVIKEQSLKTRKIGLGVMGFADMLVKLGIPYGSKKALELATKVMKDVNYTAHCVSTTFNVNHYIDDQFAYSNRGNSSVTSIAPNGTIGLIFNVNGGIEPFFALAYTRTMTNHDGTKTKFNVAVEPFEDEFKDYEKYDKLLSDVVANGGKLNVSIAEEHGITYKQLNKFVTSSEIAPENHVITQSMFQMHTEMGVSKTVNLPKNATIDDVKKIYFMAWETKCKGITVYRDGCREDQVLTTGRENKNSDKSEYYKDNGQEWTYKGKKDRPRKLSGYTWSVRTENGRYYITINGVDNTPLEIFASPHSDNLEGNVDAEALCRTISLLLRSGVPLELIKDQLNKVRNQCLLSLPHNIELCLEEFVEGNMGGIEKCPECGEMALIHEGGCSNCSSCGWSKCG